MNKTIYGLLIMLGIFGAVLVFTQVSKTDEMEEKSMNANRNEPLNTKSAVFAGGCFWCTEADFDKIDGVLEVISGYTGGDVKNPSYEEVSSGGTGHIEAIKVIYDPAKISYTDLLNYFWRHVDPTDEGGQFVDRGGQYISAVFYSNDKEKELAKRSKKALEQSRVFSKPVVTKILPLGEFYRAEDYHQDYHKEHGIRYKWYRSGSGRDNFLEKAWQEHPEWSFTPESSGMTSDARAKANSKTKLNSSSPMTDKAGAKPPHEIPSKTELRRILSPLQYKVSQEDGTEPAFDNKYWDNHEPGIYVDIVSGEPLFSSKDKFESGTGWPSFTRPLEPENIVEKEDPSWFTTRTEVRSKHADSHLGHVFIDGPPPTGLRYCMNSAALKFIHKNDLAKEGYGEYEKLFK